MYGNTDLKETNMSESKMLGMAKDFAVDVINICRTIKERQREGLLTTQLLRSATSIGANIHESKYGQSPQDFISKMQIALKECYESEYWLELLVKTNYLDSETYKRLRNSCGAIRRMLISSINTTRSNMEK